MYSGLWDPRVVLPGQQGYPTRGPSCTIIVCPGNQHASPSNYFEPALSMHGSDLSLYRRRETGELGARSPEASFLQLRSTGDETHPPPIFVEFITRERRRYTRTRAQTLAIYERWTSARSCVSAVVHDLTPASGFGMKAGTSFRESQECDVTCPSKDPVTPSACSRSRSRRSKPHVENTLLC